MMAAGRNGRIVSWHYSVIRTRKAGYLNFFTEICASAEIAEVILYNANLFDISPALAVALAWEESHLNPRAVNNRNRNESIDRGLFQLNDRSFPRLEVQAFFNPETNAWYAMNHLRHCLDTGGTEVAALAMYNAGTNRVRGAGTPKTTLDYISRILENRWEIEDRFRDWEIRFREQQLELEDFSELAEIKPERARLVPLMPLSGK
jgi:soluble lytic murein transglycosylase-like protein